jgi:hypothetical protein
MKQEDYLFKTRPQYLLIIFSIVSAIASAYIGYIIWQSNKATPRADERTGHIIAMIFSGFFIMFSLVCLYCFSRVEICYLTKDELIISRPLLFFYHKILLSDIERMTEKEDKIDIDQKSFTPDLATIGHTTSIWLKNGKQVKISSIEVWGYKELIKKINTQMRIKKG